MITLSQAWRGGLVACALASFAAGAAPRYPVLPAQSSLQFAATQQGERFTGVFKSFDAHIQYAPEDLAGSHFDVIIPLKSLDSRSPDRDQALANADWFDFAHFPNATFHTLAMRATPTGVVADADVTIKGRTKRIAFPFAWKAAASGATLDARVTLDRLDFGLGTGEWADEASVGHKVEVSVHLTLGPGVADPASASAPRPTARSTPKPTSKPKR